MRSFSIALILIFMCSLTALAERPRPLGWALKAMRSGDWDAATQLAYRDGPVAIDIIEWHKLRAGLGSYEDIITFLDRRPNWPGEAYLRRQSEAIVLNQNDDKILSFFVQNIAQTPEGVLGHAQALARAGSNDLAEANLILEWRTVAMESATQKQYLDNYAELLSPHHVARLNAMLWSGNSPSAKRMLDLVPAEQKVLAEARLALKSQSDSVDALIKAVPKTLRGNSGLAHDRFEWRVRKGRWADAKTLLHERSTSTESLGKPSAWAQRRRALARDEMRDGDSTLAYELAARHFLSEGPSYADLEWLAGYIALRKLNEPKTALVHFQNHRSVIKSPISRGRAAYWTGRAYEELGDEAAASQAYADGAKFQTSFYGLLSAERGNELVDPYLSGAEIFEDWKISNLTNLDLFEAGMLLQASGELSIAERFWTHLAESLDREEAGQLGQATLEMEQPHLAVMISKRAARRGIVLHASYYPLHPLIRIDLPMAPEMNLAIARRESEFDPSVQSGAGARGLMQIMPTTASEVADSLDRAGEHTTERLISDPEYNAKLGAAFLSQLSGRFNGNVVLMSAAYNAGPSRVDKWVNLLGDPRQGKDKFDVIDWIEHIPYRETRNYVMRVTESLPIYRARLGKSPLPVPFSTELTGSTLLPFAPKGE